MQLNRQHYSNTTRDVNYRKISFLSLDRLIPGLSLDLILSEDLPIIVAGDSSHHRIH